MLTWTHGCAGHLLGHTALQRRLTGTPTVVRGDVCAHRLAISSPHCVLIANTWASAGRGLSQPFEAEGLMAPLPVSTVRK